MTMPLTRPEIVRHADGTEEVIHVPVSVEERRLAEKAAEFHLTHRDPKNYSTQTRTEVTGADGGPVELSAEKAYERFLSLFGADDDDAA
jgi:hypothetical protein